MTPADLFGWQQEAEAKAALEAAEADRRVALRRALYAPRGEVKTRAQRAKDATTEALRAGLALAKARSAG